MYLSRGLIKTLLVSLPVLGFGGLGCTQAKLFALPTVYPVVTLQVQNYCPQDWAGTYTFNYKDIFFYNANSYFSGYQYILDTDGDGLPDSFEQNSANMLLWNVNYLFADTNQDGYSDLVTVNMGIVGSSQANIPVCTIIPTWQDSDNDGLTDCEEGLVGTNSTLADTDGDGVPDGIEFRFGMNPLLADTQNQLSGDGFTNYQKAKWGVPISTFLNTKAQTLLPTYQQANTTNTGGATCANPITFNIGNISILPVTGGNSLHLVTVEDPQSIVVGGSHNARQSQALLVQIPSGIATGSTVIVTTGFTNPVVNNPTILAPSGG